METETERIKVINKFLDDTFPNEPVWKRTLRFDTIEKLLENEKVKREKKKG